MAISAVFIDKDGTLVENDPESMDPRRFQLMPGAGDALAALNAEGFRLFVVTNQPAIAHGRSSIEALRECEAELKKSLRRSGAELSGFYWCPHDPCGVVPELAVDCLCRKPRPGLLDRAVLEHGVDCSRSWMLGDILHDVEAGHRAGCRSILLDSGGETEWQITSIRRPDWVVYSLEQAAQLIIKDRRERRPPLLNAGAARLC